MKQDPIICGSFYRPLFEHLDGEHGLTLTESEMNEIVLIVRKMDATSRRSDENEMPLPFLGFYPENPIELWVVIPAIVMSIACIAWSVFAIWFALNSAK